LSLTQKIVDPKQEGVAKVSGAGQPREGLEAEIEGISVKDEILPAVSPPVNPLPGDLEIPEMDSSLLQDLV